MFCHMQAKNGGQELVEQTVARILSCLRAFKCPQLPTP